MFHLLENVSGAAGRAPGGSWVPASTTLATPVQAGIKDTNSKFYTLLIGFVNYN